MEPNTLTAAVHEPPAILARLEVDRFCDGCGYNLYSQGVFCDEQTQILMCRCPECGRFHAVRDGVTAGRVWLQRLGTFLLLIWLWLVVSLVASLALAQLGIIVGTLDELTRYDWDASTVTTTQVTLPGGQVITYPTGPSAGRITPRGDFPYRREFLMLMASLAAASGFVLVTWLTITVHHWRRWAYLIPTAVVPLVVGVGVGWAWSQHCPHLVTWSVPYIGGLSAANLIGGLAGVWLGRPFARLVAILCVPPRTRQVLAFLWTADGKPPPPYRTATT